MLNSFDGLSSDHVKQTIEDKDGMIWFATSKGLNRYDGKNILRYKASQPGEKGIPHNDVRTLLLTQSGELWIGTQKGLVKKLNNDNFVEISNETLGDDVFPSDQIIKLIQSKNGNIWIATQKGLVIISPDLKNYHTYRSNYELDSSQLPFSDIVDIFEDRFGNVWLSTWAGGITLAISENPSDLHSFKFSSMNAEELELPKGITFSKILQDDNDKIWLQEAYGVFYRIDIKVGNLSEGLSNENIELKRFDFDIFDDTENFVSTTSYIDGRGLFVSTFKGAYVIPLDMLDGSPKISSKKNKVIEGLTLGLDTKEDVFIDSRNIVWLASNKGVFMYFGLVNVLFNKYPSYPSLIEKTRVSAIYHDYSGTWLGTDDGLFIDNRKELEEIKYQQNPIVGVTSFESAPDGNIWIGTIDGKFYEIDKKADGYKIIHRTVEGLDDYNGNNHIWSIQAMPNGKLWLGTHVGVYIYDRFSHATIKLAFHLMDTRLYDFNCFDIEKAENDGVYISATGIGLIMGTPDSSKEGGYHYEIRTQGTSKSEMSSNVIFDLEVTDKKVLLAQNTGLEIYDIELDSFYRIPKLDAAVNGQVYSILYFSGKTWATTPMGLTSYSEAEDVIQNFNINDGIIDNHSMLGHYKDSNGDIFLAGSGGYHILGNNEEYEKEVSKEIILSHLSINNKSVNAGESYSGYSTPILTKELNETDAITLSHSENNVVINFSVHDFINPHQYEYSYILKGISDDWVHLGQEQKINFTQLPQQDFELGIKAMDQFGQWTEPRFISVRVLRPMWQKTGNIIGLGLLFLLGIYFAVKYREKKANERNIQLEKAVEQRTLKLKEQNQELEKHIESNIKLENFAHAASHDLKAPMRNIVAFAGLLKRKLAEKLTEKELGYFVEIENGTSRLNNLIDDILTYSKLNSEDLNLTSVSLAKIINEVIDSLSTSIEEKGAIINFQNNEALDQLVADNIKISRVIQNLLTNSIKFMPEERKPEIDIWLEEDEGSKCVHIKDNGIGISEKNQNHVFEMFRRVANSSAFDGTGFGLTISKKIMNLHQGDLLLSSELGKGSIFTLEFPKSSKK